MRLKKPGDHSRRSGRLDSQRRRRRLGVTFGVMVAVDQNGGTRTFNSCSAKYARFLKLPSAEAGRQRERVSSSLEGVPTVAVEKVYDGDPSN